jgi:hypothetical protein
MFFFNDRRHHLTEKAPTLGVYGDGQEAAIAMSQRIWDGLAAEETALGYSLLDTRTGRICYIEIRDRRAADRVRDLGESVTTCRAPTR